MADCICGANGVHADHFDHCEKALLLARDRLIEASGTILELWDQGSLTAHRVWPYLEWSNTVRAIKAMEILRQALLLTKSQVLPEPYASNPHV